MTEIAPEEETSRKALRSLLTSYYGIEEALESPELTENATNAEKENSKGEVQAETLLRTLNLSDLMKKTFELKAETEEINSKLKHLLYSSYQKLEETANTVHQMAEEAPNLQHTIEGALERMVSVEEGNQQVNESLWKGRNKVQLLESCSKLLTTLRVAEQLRENMVSLHQKGQTSQVASLFQSITSILSRISSESTYAATFVRDLQLCSYEIRHDLLQRLEDEEEKLDQNEDLFRNILSSLIMFDESQSVIRDVLLRHARRKLSSSVDSYLGSWKESFGSQVWKFFTCCVLWLKNSFIPISIDIFKTASLIPSEQTILTKLLSIFHDQLILFRDDYLVRVMNEDITLLEEDEEETREFFQITEDIRFSLDTSLPVKDVLHEVLEAILLKWKQCVLVATYNSFVRLLNKIIVSTSSGDQVYQLSLENELKHIFERCSFLLSRLEVWKSLQQPVGETLSKDLFLQAVTYCSRYECKRPIQMLLLSYFLHCLNPSYFDTETITFGDSLLQEYVLWRSFLLQVEFCSCSSYYLETDSSSSSFHVSKVKQQILDIFQEIVLVLLDGKLVSESGVYHNPALSWEHFDTLFVSNRPVEFETPVFEDQVLIICILQRATRFWQEFLRLRKLSSNSLEQLKSDVSTFIDTYLSLGVRFRKELLNKLYISFQAVLSTGNESTS